MDGPPWADSNAASGTATALLTRGTSGKASSGHAGTGVTGSAREMLTLAGESAVAMRAAPRKGTARSGSVSAHGGGARNRAFYRVR